jgi:class 3 adenylate cyclase
VLFCDLVGSTQLATKTNPEILGTVIRRYQDAAAGAIGRFSGFVAKFMGDGVLAYFGFPQAQEDARKRANALVELARRSGDSDRLLEPYHCGWSTAFFREDLATTIELSEIGIRTYDIDRHRIWD